MNIVPWTPSVSSANRNDFNTINELVPNIALQKLTPNSRKFSGINSAMTESANVEMANDCTKITKLRLTCEYKKTHDYFLLS